MQRCGPILSTREETGTVEQSKYLCCSMQICTALKQKLAQRLVAKASSNVEWSAEKLNV